MGHVVVVSRFFLLLTDHTIKEKLIIFTFIVDMQAKWLYGQEPKLIYNKIMQHSRRYACIFWQCVIIFAHGVPIMGFKTKSNS